MAYVHGTFLAVADLLFASFAGRSRELLVLFWLFMGTTGTFDAQWFIAVVVLHVWQFRGSCWSEVRMRPTSSCSMSP